MGRGESPWGVMCRRYVRTRPSTVIEPATVRPEGAAKRETPTTAAKKTTTADSARPVRPERLIVHLLGGKDAAGGFPFTSEPLAHEHDGASGLRNAALRFDRDGELHGRLAEVLLPGNGDDGRAVGARVERAGGDGLVAHERPQFVALLERQRREAADPQDSLLRFGIPEEFRLRGRVRLETLQEGELDARILQPRELGFLRLQVAILVVEHSF